VIPTFSEYYTRLKILWKELELYRCFLLCTCSSICSYGLIPKLKKEREDDCVICFLHGLNDVYAPIRSQVLLMEPMPSLVKTFSLVVQHEREFIGESSSQSPTNTTAFSTVKNSDNSTSFSKSFSNHNKISSNSGKGSKGISFALIVEKLIILLRHVFSSMDFLLDIEIMVKEVLQISNLLLAWLKHILIQLHNMVPWRTILAKTSFICPKINTMPS